MKNFIRHIFTATLLGLVIYTFILGVATYQGEQIDWVWFKQGLAINFSYTFPMYFTGAFSFVLAKKLRRKFAVKDWVYWLIFTPIVAILNMIALIFVQFFIQRIILDNANYHLIGEHFWQQFKGPLLFSLTIGTGFYLVNFIQAYRREKSKAKDQALKKSQRSNEALQSQIGPHFLFNSLNVLSGLVEENPKKAQNFIEDLSQVYRYVLDQKEKDWCLLSEEIDFAENYIQLIQTRFEEGLQVDISPELKDLEKYLPPLSLQLVLENCVKHNSVSPQNPLQIKIYKEGNLLIIWNNRNPKKQWAKRKGKGLQNIQKRYKLSGYSVEIKKSETEFSIQLPLLSLEDIRKENIFTKDEGKEAQKLLEKRKQENQMENNQKQVKTIADSVFIGCMFIGAGIGFWYNNVVIGGAIGMGFGFFAKAVILSYYK